MDYKAILDEAYQQMIATREPDAPTVISTFAGGGGSSAGYHMAGYNELMAVEWDDNAVQTLRLNFPHLDVYHGDIAKLSVNEVLKRTGLAVGQLDVFDGSPPCQGFSTAGKRDFGDDRNQLFREYVRLLRGLQPKVFVMENVSGMVKGKMKILFVEILKELKSSGYMVSARLLNAKYFNVPQSRERMIFIGVRDDLNVEPSHPKAESGEIVFCDATAGVLSNGKPLEGFLASFAPLQPRNSWSSDLKKWKKAKGKLSGSLSTKWASNNSVCGTLAKSWIAGTGVIHPDKDRYLCIDEMRRIGAFPDDYKFIGNFEDMVARIGNSVPPLFMRAISRHIRNEILLAAELNRS